MRVVNNGAGGGSRWVDVPAERFPRWTASFAARHRVPASAGPDDAAVAEADELLGVTLDGRNVIFTAPDGAVAECHPPFPESMARPEPAVPPRATALAAAVAAHAASPRAVGVLLVRLGGYAAGVFTGYPPVLADAKVGSRPVHGRSAAGGWSQHRFARRREKQASEALEAAAEAAVRVFGRWPDGITATGGGAAPASGVRLDAVVLGGDKRAAAGLREDPRLAPYLALATDRFLTVPDPKRAVLAGTPKLFLAVRIRLAGPSA